jgi:hypothetical protein
MHHCVSDRFQRFEFLRLLDSESADGLKRSVSEQNTKEHDPLRLSMGPELSILSLALFHRPSGKHKLIGKATRAIDALAVVLVNICPYDPTTLGPYGHFDLFLAAADSYTVQVALKDVIHLFDCVWCEC